MSLRGRAGNRDRSQKNQVQEIVDFTLKEIEKDSSKIGVLLCEGEENSIDKVVYSALFPNLIVIPLGGCSNVMRLLRRVRKSLSAYEIYAFGIIDRDALSKPEIKKFERNEWCLYD